jgi:hypothetical protein
MNAQNWYEYIPVVLNVTYGDPFIPQQVDDTIEKLKDMMNQKVPIALLTKAPYDKEVLIKLREVAHNPMVLPFYSLTGLNEGGYSFENRVKMIEGLEEVFNKPVIITTRPIIRGQNDDPKILQSLVDVAKTHSKLLVLGGVHDMHKKKKISSDVESLIVEMCDTANVKCFHKTTCLVSYLQGRKQCAMHDHIGPVNLDIARQLGYEFSVSNNLMTLDFASTGDLNFLRMLTHSEVTAKEILSNYNLLTISTPELLLESTSSWFVWSRNIEHCVGCNYCIILQLEYLERKRVTIGLNPRDLLSRAGKQSLHLFSEFKRTKLKIIDKPAKEYEQVRVTKPCFLNRYEPLENPFYPLSSQAYASAV